MSNRTKPDWEDKFIEFLSRNPSVALAARGANIHRTTAYSYRRQSKEFAQRWAKAKAEAVELLEAQAWSRAEKQSDTLMIFLLKANKPDKYQERKTIIHEFNHKELAQLKQLKAVLDKHGQSAGELFQDLINEYAALERHVDDQ